MLRRLVPFLFALSLLPLAPATQADAESSQTARYVGTDLVFVALAPVGYYGGLDGRATWTCSAFEEVYPGMACFEHHGPETLARVAWQDASGLPVALSVYVFGPGGYATNMCEPGTLPHKLRPGVVVVAGPSSAPEACGETRIAGTTGTVTLTT